MTGLLEYALALWRECPESLPPLRRTYSASEQEQREAELDRFIACIQGELQRIPKTRAERQEARERITAGFVRFGRTAAEMDDRHLALLLGDGFSAIGSGMAREARRFDPQVSTDDIFQASRNAWTACGLQKLLGRPMALTPAIFAYSMLYPFTDNYLDDPAVGSDAKAGFNDRFGRRLAGAAVAPANGHEAAIWRLIGMIEGQYSRETHAQVFESLLAIFHAQANSLRLLRRRSTEGVDVLRLVFDKGGASVLADGYLAAGGLSAEQGRFVFSWGVLLQLADDLQDVREDRDNGVLTLFSDAAARGPLDALVSRTLNFAIRVMSGLESIGAADCRPLKDLIARSSISLLVRATGEARALFTPQYVDEMERHSAFRFAFLEERRKRLARHGGLMNKLFEAFLAGDPDEMAFPLLPGSLFPRF